MAERGRPRGFDSERALRAAMEVFWEYGYEGASLAELCSAMGVNAPSVYGAFGTKEQLFRKAVALYELREGIAPPPGLPVRDSVAALLRAGALAYTEPGRPRGCLVVLGATTYTPKTEGVRDHLTGRRRAQLAELRTGFVRAIDAGELPPAADPDVLAGYVCATLAGMSVRARDGASRAELLAVARAGLAGWDALAAGVGTPDPDGGADGGAVGGDPGRSGPRPGG